jgi:hypothetical protein
VNQRINQQFDEDFFRNFELSKTVKALIALNMMQVSFNKSQATPVLFFQITLNIFAVEVVFVIENLTWKSNGGDFTDMQAALRVFTKQ